MFLKTSKIGPNSFLKYNKKRVRPGLNHHENRLLDLPKISFCRVDPVRILTFN